MTGTLRSFDMSKFGKRLRELRKERKLTQVELGKVIKTSHATINRYENSIHQPDIETINNLADFFNVTTDYLLGRTNRKEMAIIEGEEIPKELKDIGIEYLEISKELKEKGFKPQDIKELIKAIEKMRNSTQ